MSIQFDTSRTSYWSWLVSHRHYAVIPALLGLTHVSGSTVTARLGLLTTVMVGRGNAVSGMLRAAVTASGVRSPDSTAAWSNVKLPVQTSCCPTSKSPPAGHGSVSIEHVKVALLELATKPGTVSSSDCNLTLPLFSSVREYATMSPAAQDKGGRC